MGTYRLDMFSDFIGWLKDKHEDDPTKFVRVASAVVVLVVLLIISVSVKAKPVATLTDEKGVVITLTDETCHLKHIVNLPYRASWTDRGKVTHGCFGAAGPFFIFYYEDKDVGLVPMRAFSPLSSM